MSVYVDDMEAEYSYTGSRKFYTMKMCHMIADTTEELLDMAGRIGVRPKWIQDAGTYREHFDICRSKRALAVEHGAIQVSMRELALKVRLRRLLEPQESRVFRLREEA